MMSVFKDSPVSRQFNRMKRIGYITLEATTSELVMLQDRDGQRVFIKLEEIDPLIEALQAFKAAGEYDRLAETEADKLKRWQEVVCYTQLNPKKRSLG